MKRLLGIYPLIIYILEFLLIGGVATIFLSMTHDAEGTVQAPNGLAEALGGTLGTISGGIAVVIVMAIALIPLLLVIFKGIHLATGNGLFGVFCIIADIAVLALFFSNGKGDFLIPAIAMGGSLVCNVISLAR